MQDKLDREYFKRGLSKMVDILRPCSIVNYSCTPDEIFGQYREQGISIIGIENYALTVRKAAV